MTEELKLTGEYTVEERISEAIQVIVTGCDHFDNDEAPVCNMCTGKAIDAARKEFNTEIATLRAKLADSEDRLVECREACADNAVTIKTLRAKLAEAERENAHWLTRLDELGTEIGDAWWSVRRAGIVLHSGIGLREAVNMLAAALTQARADLEVKEAQAREYAAMTNRAQDERDQARAEAAHAAEDARKFALEAVNEIEKRERAEAALREALDVPAGWAAGQHMREIVRAYFTTQKGSTEV